MKSQIYKHKKLKNIFRFNTKYILFVFLFTLLILSCSDKFDFDPDINDTSVSSGLADFSKFISLGNSLTAGYADGALYSSAQLQSYPSIIAAQMQLAGGGTFKQPLMPNDVGGFTDLPNFPGKLYLAINADGSLNTSPEVNSSAAALDNVSSGGPYQNLGIPGAKSSHLLALGYGNPAGLEASQAKANPYFVRFATSTSTSVIADALAQNPTFFSLWIGNNDVLGYATTGGDGTNPITSIDSFTEDYTTIINQLVGTSSRKGVIANIPYVTFIPFFTTVPSKPFSTLTPTQINQLNEGYAVYNEGLITLQGLGLMSAKEVETRKIVFTNGVENGAVMIDEYLTDFTGFELPSYRLTTSDDLILLTTAEFLATGGGTQFPLTDKDVLSKNEIIECATAVDAFNSTIADLASSNGLAYYNANADLQALKSKSGIIFNGETISASYISGGAFSLDGIHPTSRGYSIIANGFIKAINSKYGSTLPQVNPNNYNGVTFP